MGTDEYYTITGPLNYSYEEYKIEPRSGADISIGMGTNEITIEEVNIYPNPSSDMISFNAGTANEMAVVNFYDSRGRIVVTKEVSMEHFTDVSYFYPGTYQMECIKGTSIYKSSVLIFRTCIQVKPYPPTFKQAIVHLVSVAWS